MQGVSCTDTERRFVHHAAAMKQLILTETDHRVACGFRLRQLIDALGISYVQAASEMGVTKNHLGNWMRGVAYPKHYELYRFCRIRGVNTDWVLLGDPSGLPAKVYEPLMKLAQELEAPAEPASQASESL